MKKLALFTLLAALIVSCKSEGKKDEAPKESGSAQELSKESSGIKIAYYNVDSITTTFDAYVDEMKRLEKQNQVIESQFNAIQNNLNNAYTRYETGMKTQSLTENNRINLENTIKGYQEELQRFQNTKMASFQQEQMNSTEVILNKIEKYAEEYAKANGITLLFFKGAGSTITYASDAFDVTVGFVEYMNAKEKELNGGK